nr:MAG TPA: hypothetical protein [Caudoviricetes sp.]
MSRILGTLAMENHPFNIYLQFCNTPNFDKIQIK